MLSEGWDVKSVTHILGLRAFGSPLLTEQIIGRGLRRTNYDVLNQPLEERPEGSEETVDAFGIPFVGFPVEKRKRPQDRRVGSEADLDRAGREEGEVPRAGAERALVGGRRDGVAGGSDPGRGPAADPASTRRKRRRMCTCGPWWAARPRRS